MTTTLPHEPAGSDGAPPPGPVPGGPPGSSGSPGSAPAAGSALDEAAARLHAWHAVRGDAPRSPAEGDVGIPDVGTPDIGARGVDAWGAGAEDVGEPDDELAERLRARRSARHVAAAYAAAHGHPLDEAHDRGGARRWSLGLRLAVVASLAVLLVAVVVAVVATVRPDGVTTLAGGDASSWPSVHASAASSAESSEAPTTGSSPQPSTDRSAAPASDPSAAGVVVVHVVGEVSEPGLVTVPVGARVADAVAAAGGTTRRADTAAVNLARAVVDGEQIRVPRPGEAPQEAAPAAGGAPTSGEGGAGGVDLNTASAAELEELPGIGPALAERVVAWRDENGPFTSVDELDEVSGIGPSVLEQVRDLVRL